MRISLLLAFLILGPLKTVEAAFRSPTEVASRELPSRMAALGDSITAGAVANFNRVEDNNNIFLLKFFWSLTEYGYRRSLAAFEERQLSWATGTSRKVSSHLQKINDLYRSRKIKAKVEGVNVAVSGDNSFGLDAQVARVLERFGESPEYVVLNIGSNDACVDNQEEMTSAAEYAQNVEEALDTLLSKGAQTRILIGGLPNAYHLRQVAEQSPIGGIPLVKSCQDMWAVHDFCRNLLQEENPELQRAVERRFQEYMHELTGVSTRLQQKWGADRLRVAEEVFAYPFSDEDISIDCFHPNRSGQQILSDLSWKQSWWN